MLHLSIAFYPSALQTSAKSEPAGGTMTNSWRFSTLGDRHRALGSNLEDWSGMGTAWSYAGDPEAEYMAIRTKAGLMDVSGLKRCISPALQPAM